MSILTDIAALAKAGYNYDQVKELITLSKTTTIDDGLSSKGHGTDGAGNDDAPAPEVSPEKDETPDYKSLYESTKKDLEKLQSDNTKSEIVEKPLTVDSIVKDLSAFLK